MSSFEEYKQHQFRINFKPKLIDKFIIKIFILIGKILKLNHEKNKNRIKGIFL